ncbi:unnamed protein product [Urochloa humidicola]
MDGEYNIHDELDSILRDGSSEPQNLPLEYLRKITNNFADDRLLGEGGFGKVYKGVLQNGKLVAVKKLDQLKPGIQQRQFENEHNGKYIFAEMPQKLICLEYMPNGSLDRHLSDESSGHDWHTRYKIIKGICCGLHYLHEECQCQFSASIIHLDLKPANILLDDNMGPKVADFGLSRLFEDTKTHTCATFVSGSLGYMAPEYLIGRIVTTKADIYNLGVIIIEIITGSKVNIFSYSSTSSWQDFVECVLESWRSRSRLEGAPSETDCKQIKCCLEIGLDCIKFNREERPTSREIIERLDRFENTYCNSDSEETPPADQPDITGTSSTACSDNNNDTRARRCGGGAPRSCGSPNRTSVRGLFRRQLLRLMRHMTRQLSCVLMPLERCRRPRIQVTTCGGSAVAYRLASSEGSSEDELSLPSSIMDNPAENFTFAELEVATKDFALEAKIGVGTFGTVYHGKLHDGREVAIKRGDESRPRARRFQERAFRSELAFFSRYNHRHIVGLVGCCEENEKRLLVYEYMKNGSLYDHLHPKAATPSSPSPVVTSWKLRIRILLDASRGIEYLHSYAVPPIIHRNIKSSNILLDAGWTARASDIGLSVLEPEAQAHLTVKAAGMVGYMDPEYDDQRHLTAKSDVYSFGVVMLEVLTGKRAIFRDAEDGSTVSVVDYAVPSIVDGELSKILDSRTPEPAAHEAEAVELVAYTAVHCVRLEGKDRPAMDDIVANLDTAFALCDCDETSGLSVTDRKDEMYFFSQKYNQATCRYLLKQSFCFVSIILLT